MKNWTKSLDLFSKDFIVVPVNRNYHWFVSVICYPSEVPDDESEITVLSDDGQIKPRT